jgi:hypothetical protein
MGHRPAKTLQSFLARSSFMSTLLAIITISILSIIIISVNVHRYTDTICRQEIDRMTLAGDNFVERLRGFIIDFSYTPDFQRILLDYNRGANRNINSIWLAMNRYWESYENTLSRAVNNAAVFSLNGDMLGSLRGFPPGTRAGNFPWFGELEKSQGEIIWPRITMESGRRTITLVKKIRAVGINIGEDLGYLLIYIDSSELRNLVAGDLMPPNYRVYIFDPESAMLAGGEGNNGGSSFPAAAVPDGSIIRHNGGWYLCYSTLIRFSGWKVVYLTNMTLLIRDIGVALMVYIVIAVLALFLFFLISVHAARIITRPIKALQGRFFRLENGNFDAIPEKTTGIQEIDELRNCYEITLTIDKEVV